MAEMEEDPLEISTFDLADRDPLDLGFEFEDGDMFIDDGLDGHS
jgi:hypothetical protein